MNSQLRIVIGILFTLLTCVPLAVVAYNDLGAGFGFAPNSDKTVMEKRADALAGHRRRLPRLRRADRPLAPAGSLPIIP